MKLNFTVSISDRLLGLLSRVFSRRKTVIITFISVMAVSVFAYAAAIEKPFTFEDGKIASADDVNENFDALYEKVNELDDVIGNVTNTGSLWDYNGGDISYSAGNVGIGTNSPSAMVEVRNDNDGTTQLRIENGHSGTNAYTQLTLGNDLGNSVFGLWLNSSTNAEGAGFGSVNFYLGTAHPLAFYTTGTERMRIDKDGNVGIGVDTPSSSLHVEDQVDIGVSGTTGGVLSLLPGAGNAVTWNLRNNDNTSLEITRNGEIDVVMTRWPAADVLYRRFGFGIGSIDNIHPSAGFHIKSKGELVYENMGTGSVIRLLRNNVHGSDSGVAAVRFCGLNAASVEKEYGLIWGRCLDDTAGSEIGELRLITLYNGTDNHTVTVRENKVGINTTNPQYTLDVDGDIRATGSIYYGGNPGATDGTAYDKPDYVFEPGYKIKSIEEVAAYIAKEKHLPWVASTKEEKKGMVNITRMSFQTLEAAENLQMQIIGLNKKVKALESENGNLKERLNSLESRLQALEKGEVSLAGKNSERSFFQHLAANFMSWLRGLIA